MWDLPKGTVLDANRNTMGPTQRISGPEDAVLKQTPKPTPVMIIGDIAKHLWEVVQSKDVAIKERKVPRVKEERSEMRGKEVKSQSFEEGSWLEFCVERDGVGGERKSLTGESFDSHTKNYEHYAKSEEWP